MTSLLMIPTLAGFQCEMGFGCTYCQSQLLDEKAVKDLAVKHGGWEWGCGEGRSAVVSFVILLYLPLRVRGLEVSGRFIAPITTQIPSFCPS